MTNISSRDIFSLWKKEFRNKDENILIAYYLIAKIGYFSTRLDTLLMPSLAKKLQAMEVGRDMVIVRQGDEADCMFIMYRGHAEVEVKVSWGLILGENSS
jgi:CRP-like cAMP-binding protein